MAAARVRRTSVLERGPDGSVINCSELSGGLRVVTESVPGARSVSVGVWVGVGSVDETPRLAGASHYLEHLLFKGTRFRTGYDIAAAVDAVGGELNAFTAHEYTCFYARMLSDEAQLAVSLVCEVVLDATIAGADVDTERSVILEEIAMRDDDPEDTLADAFAAGMFVGHPVSAPVIGSIQTISAMTRTQVAGYYHRRTPPARWSWQWPAASSTATSCGGCAPHSGTGSAMPGRGRTGRWSGRRRHAADAAGSAPDGPPWSCIGRPNRLTCASACRPGIATTPIEPRSRYCPASSGAA